MSVTNNENRPSLLINERKETSQDEGSNMGSARSDSKLFAKPDENAEGDSNMFKPLPKIHIKLAAQNDDEKSNDEGKAAVDMFKSNIRQPSDISVIIEEEDASDLIYDKELKMLLEDHKSVTRFLMIIAIAVMLAQIVFALWCLSNLLEIGTWEDSILLNWFHTLKVLMNLMVTQTFFKRLKAKQPSSPLAYLSSYVTLSFYLAFLFVYTDDLPKNVDQEHITIMLAYPGTDWLMILVSWCFQRNIIMRRDELFKFQAGGVTQEKKEDDLFDVRYLPEEYMSDVQADSDEEEDDDEPVFKASTMPETPKGKSGEGVSFSQSQTPAQS